MNIMDSNAMPRLSNMQVAAPQSVDAADTPPSYSEAIGESKNADEQKFMSIYNGNISNTVVINDQNIPFPKLHIVCVIDVSGSMGTKVDIPDSAKEESGALSIMQLVQHALRTIIHSLSQEDRLSLITYSDNAINIFTYMDMSVRNKSVADCYVDGLKPTYTTNLWDGIQSGLNCAKKNDVPNQLTTIMVLTDGIPTREYVPPRGHASMMTKYFDRYSKYKVDTSVFGYTADSAEMNKIAECSNGSFYFIPDGGFVGTVFIHWLANVKTTYTQDAELSIESDEPIEIVGIASNKTAWGTSVSLGSLQKGQPRHITYTGNAKSVTLRYTYNNNTISRSINADIPIDEEGDDITRINVVRQSIIAILNTCIYGRLDMCQALIQSFMRMIDDTPEYRIQRVQDMIADVSGQFTEAVADSDAFTKWGGDYLYSIRHAYIKEQRINFKDPGIQHFGGKEFELCVESAEEVFMKINPPKATKVVSTYDNQSGRYTQQTITQSVNMSSYYDRDAGCIHGNCNVMLAGGFTRKVRNIRHGDKVRSVDGTISTVVLVLRIKTGGEKTMAVYPDGLTITEWHPIWKLGRWAFPANDNRCFTREIETDYVYNFVLHGHYQMCVNGIDVITLNHGISNDAIATHDYFGNHIMHDLWGMSGFAEGYITLVANPFIREDGKITRMVSNAEIDTHIPNAEKKSDVDE